MELGEVYYAKAFLNDDRECYVWMIVRKGHEFWADGLVCLDLETGEMHETREKALQYWTRLT